jgi:hypothetical protein
MPVTMKVAETSRTFAPDIILVKQDILDVRSWVGGKTPRYRPYSLVKLACILRKTDALG